MLLLHAPIDHENRVDQWKALEQIKQDGLAKSIGLAYMTNIQLTDLIKNCTIIPSVLEVSAVSCMIFLLNLLVQMEYSPFGQSEEIIEFCQDNGVALLVDEPNVKNMRHNHPEVMNIADELGISKDEVIIFNL